jgi:hypothetical protein
MLDEEEGVYYSCGMHLLGHRDVVMLDIVRFAVAPSGKQPDKELVGKMNRARGLRNEYMHKGVRPKDPGEIAALLDSTREYVCSLRAAERGAEAVTAPAVETGPATG